MSQEQLEQFRRMTPAERWAIWRELCDLGVTVWERSLSPEEIDRRWAVWRRQHDLSDAEMLRCLRSASKPPATT